MSELDRTVVEFLWLVAMGFNLWSHVEIGGLRRRLSKLETIEPPKEQPK